MKLPKLQQDLKRQVIRSLKRILAPHVWKSGYEGTMLFCFAKVNGKDTRSMGKVFDEDLTCLQGFYDGGCIDAFGGGCMCSPFESYCLEDLLAIERWLNKNFAKEIPRAMKANEDHRLHDEWVAGKDGWRKGVTFEKWKKKRKEFDNSNKCAKVLP